MHESKGDGNAHCLRAVAQRWAVHMSHTSVSVLHQPNRALGGMKTVPGVPPLHVIGAQLALCRAKLAFALFQVALLTHLELTVLFLS